MVIFFPDNHVCLLSIKKIKDGQMVHKQQSWHEKKKIQQIIGLRFSMMQLYLALLFLPCLFDE